jgi:hypothetical protein
MYLPSGAAELSDVLRDPPEPPTAERFDPATLGDLPEPARRWLTRALPAGTPLVGLAELTMEGSLRIGGRWRPFTACQTLRAGVGFVWAPTVGGRWLRFVGADLLGPDDARMDFRLHGIVPVSRASGPDTRRSAIGRLAAETIVWLPQAAAPQAGARWRPVDERHAAVTIDALGAEVEVGIDADGRLTTIDLDRWSDRLDPPGPDRFGGDLEDEHTTTAGVAVTGAGAVGWGHGTDRWSDGEFFRFHLTEVHHRA